jgi:transposase
MTSPPPKDEKGNYRAEDKEFFAKAIVDGFLTSPEVAKMYDMNYETVRSWVKRFEKNNGKLFTGKGRPPLLDDKSSENELCFLIRNSQKTVDRKVLEELIHETRCRRMRELGLAPEQLERASRSAVDSIETHLGIDTSTVELAFCFVFVFVARVTTTALYLYSTYNTAGFVFALHYFISQLV